MNESAVSASSSSMKGPLPARLSWIATMAITTTSTYAPATRARNAVNASTGIGASSSSGRTYDSEPSAFQSSAIVATAAREEIAGQESGPGHGAVGGECDVVGHSDRSGDCNLGGTARDVDLVERRARDAAGKQMAGLVDRKPVHAVERRARDEPCDLPVFGRNAGGGDNRSDEGCAGEPVLHGETSRFSESIRSSGRFANKT
jgi:hypothetical protein